MSSRGGHGIVAVDAEVGANHDETRSRHVRRVRPPFDVAALTPEQARDIEALGYGAIWVGGSPPAELSWVEPILGADDHAEGGHRASSTSGPRTPGPSRSRSTASRRPIPAASCSASASATPRRTPSTASRSTRSPTTSTSSTSTAFRRTAAWSPRSGRRCSSCRRERSAGAHPYLTTPEHTAEARELIGPEAFLAPEHKVVLTTDAEKARAVGRKALEIYLNLDQLPEQLEAARLHRRGRRQAGQRPHWSTPSSPTAPSTTSPRGSRSTSTREPTTCRFRC